MGLGGVARFEAGEPADVRNPALQLAADSRRGEVRQANMPSRKAPARFQGAG